MNRYALLLFFAFGVALSYLDLRERRAPDPLTLGGLSIALIFAALEGWPALLGALSGAVLGGGVLLLARLAARGGLGFGDVKFAAFMGAVLQPRPLLLGLMASAFFALAFAGMAFILGKLRRGSQIPFVPFLSAGALVAVIASDVFHLPWLN